MFSGDKGTNKLAKCKIFIQIFAVLFQYVKERRGMGFYSTL